jgi:hypothetical protein
LLFVYYIAEDAGSAQDIASYARVAAEHGHEIVLYGPACAIPSFRFSKDVASADAVVFIFEWTTQLRFGDQLDLARLVSEVPRERRIVIDCDGGYNERIESGGDYNHRDAAASRAWMDVCDSLADKIFQPALRPRRPNVRTFFFHGYNPEWERPLGSADKDYGMVYVGHSKFRWWPMYRVLQAIEPVRERVGRLALVGHGWDALPPWATWMQIEDHFYTDKAYLQKMDVEFVPPVPFGQVIDWMSRARFSPVIYRPLFSDLGFVTCRTFETFAADTIPLFGLDPHYVLQVYGKAATELVLPEERPDEKISDIIGRPGYYADIVRQIRAHLGQAHSYAARLRQLIELVQS